MSVGPTLREGQSAAGVKGSWTSVTAEADLVMPDGGVDVIWTRGRMPWIAGPDTRAKSSTIHAGLHVVGIRLAPGAVSEIIKANAPAILDQRIGLDAVVRGDTSRRLADRLHASEVADAPRVLAELVGELIRDDWEPDPNIVKEIDRIRSGGPSGVAALSRRQLRRRFTDAMGYGPKFYERIQRIDRFTKFIRTHPSVSLAQAAVSVGFHDQAHLSRDTQLLVGLTPSALSRRVRRSGP